MVLAKPGELGEVSLWSFHPGDETLFLTILEESFRGLEYVPSGKQGLSNPYFNGEGSFIAEKHGSPGGCEVIFAPGGSLPKVRREDRGRTPPAGKTVSKGPRFLKPLELKY